MRRRAVPALMLAVPLLVACGGSDDASPEPESATSPTATPATGGTPDNPFVGTYAVTSTIQRSTLEGDGNTKGDTDELGLILSCADDDCTRLTSRGSVPKGSLSRTIVLETDGSTARGERTRTGPCTQTGAAAPKGASGKYTEVATYTWRLDGDTLTGRVEYAFRGCGFDGTSRLGVSGDRVGGPTYVSREAAEMLAGPVTAYDGPVAELYAGYNGCYDQTVPRTAKCLTGLLEPWLPTFDALESALADTQAGDSCRRVMDAVRLGPLEAKVQRTLRGLGGGPALQERATQQQMGDVATTLDATHRRLVDALAVCVDPRDTSAFGDDGDLAIDVEGRLPIPS